MYTFLQEAIRVSMQRLSVVRMQLRRSMEASERMLSAASAADADRRADLDKGGVFRAEGDELLHASASVADIRLVHLAALSKGTRTLLVHFAR